MARRPVSEAKSPKKIKPVRSPGRTKYTAATMRKLLQYLKEMDQAQMKARAKRRDKGGGVARWRKNWKKVLKRNHEPELHYEPVRQLLSPWKKLGRAFPGILRRLGPHKTVMLASIDMDERRKLLKPGLKLHTDGGTFTLDDVPERWLRRLLRGGRRHRSGRPPGGSTRWMEVLTRFHRTLVPLKGRLEGSFTRWRDRSEVVRLRKTVRQPVRVYARELNALQEALEEILKLVRATRQHVGRGAARGTSTGSS